LEVVESRTGGRVASVERPNNRAKGVREHGVEEAHVSGEVERVQVTAGPPRTAKVDAEPGPWADAEEMLKAIAASGTTTESRVMR
jgi:hypothetical protein